jgi:lia operon protein LiaG
MKFNIKRFVIWITVFMFAAFITAGIILAVTGNLALAVQQIDESKTFDAEQINKIYVDLVSTDIRVIPTHEEEITVHLYGEVSTNKDMDLPSLVAYRSGDELRIEIIQTKMIFIGINIWRTKLDIYIPEDSIEVFKADTTSSDMDVSNLEVDEFEYKSVSGDFKGESLFASDIKLKSTSGDISLNDYTGDVNVGLTSGDVVLEDGSQNERIVIVTVSGDVYIEQEDSSNMNVRVISGDIEINLSEDAQFFLNANTISGHIENTFPIKITSSGRRNLEGVVGSDEKQIDVSTTSGDISLNYR